MNWLLSRNAYSMFLKVNNTLSKINMQLCNIKLHSLYANDSSCFMFHVLLLLFKMMVLTDFVLNNLSSNEPWGYFNDVN